MKTISTNSANENQESHPIMNSIERSCKHEVFGQIRILMENDGFWFKATDIAKVLWYSDIKAMKRSLDSDEFTSFKWSGMNMPPHNYINEAGLYSAMIGSRVEGARRFKRWMTREILPAIRKHSFYNADNNLKQQQLLLAEDQLFEATSANYSKKLKIEFLEWKLYESQVWAPVREISWLNDFYNLDKKGCTYHIGSSLSNMSKRLGLTPRRVAHPKLGKVNIYHQRCHSISTP